MTVANTEIGRADETAPEAHVDVPSRVCYFVLGMHRSGTSSVAGTLVKLGVAAPAHLLGANEGNETGHWESQLLIAFHDELLASAGSRWDDWRAFNPDWYDTPVAAQFRERANRLLDEEFDDAPVFVFKDPRNCRLARFWLEIFTERGIAPKIVLPIRSPLEVARSHHARDGFPLRKGLLLWLRHTLDAEAASRDLPRAVIEWDAFLSDWPSAVANIESALGAFPANTDLAAAGIDRFLRNDLKHQRVPQEELIHNPVVHEWVEQAYAAMRELASDPGANGARVELDRIRTQLNEASELFGGVLADMEAALADQIARRQEDKSLLMEAQLESDELRQNLTEERLRSEASLAKIQNDHKNLVKSYADIEKSLLSANEERDHAAFREQRALTLLEAQRLNEENIIKSYAGSWSWRITQPMRIVAIAVRRIMR